MNENGGQVGVNLKDDYYNRSKKNNRSSVIFFILIVIAVSLYSCQNGSGAIASQCDDTQLGVSCDREHYIFIPYTDIISAEYRESYTDYGTAIECSEEENVCAGTYKNDEFGEYTALCVSKMEQVIVVKYTGGVLVFNNSGKSNTEKQYEALMEHSGSFGG